MGQPRRRRAVIGLAMAVAVLGVACTGDSPTVQGPSGSGSLLPPSPTALPSFTPAAFGQLLAQLHGTPVVVNIWASWCGPCKQEAPVLAAAARTYRGKVQFLGVDIQDQRPAARTFAT